MGFQLAQVSGKLLRFFWYRALLYCALICIHCQISMYYRSGIMQDLTWDHA